MQRKTIVRCWIKMHSGDVDKRSYKSKNGEDFQGPGGMYVAPKMNEGEILRIRGVLRTTLVAFYHQGIVTPLKIATTDLEPREWGEKDMLNNGGDFITDMLRRALQDDRKQRAMLIAILLLGIAVLLNGLVNSYWIRELLSHV